MSGYSAELEALLEVRGDAPPEIQREIDKFEELYRLRSSPAELAVKLSGGAWKAYRHLVMLDEHLQALSNREIEKLMVTMPPRHGKSWLCSRYFPVWYLTTHPEHRVIMCAYESDFAESWGRQVRDIIDANAELLGIKVSEKSSAAGRWDLDGHEGGMMSAGIGGPITGKGAHLFLIDDPVKNAEEAASEAIQNRNWDWYLSTAFTRLEPGAVQILIMTRWHEADLGGMILDEHGTDWTVLNLPAFAEDDDPLGRERGEALCPERYDREALEKIKTTVGPRVWTALYQQHPTPPEGGRFKRAHFRYWTTLPSQEADQNYYRLHDNSGAATELVPKADCWRFTTWDLAATEKTSADYTVCSVWDVVPPKQDRPAVILLVHRERVRVEGADHLPLLRRLHEMWRPLWHGVEKAAVSLTMIQLAQREGFPIRELRPDKDKWARSETAATMLENGRVYWPKDAPWLDEWESELLSFPNGAHDDQVDTLAYAAIELMRSVSWRRTKQAGDKLRTMVRRRNRSKFHPELGRI